MSFASANLKALLFDVFGTVVDWRGSIIAEGQEFSRTHNLQADWGRFADAWRSGYAPSMDRVRRGEIAWCNLDVLHRMILDSILPEFGLQGLSEEQKVHLNRVWHRLRPWPDAVAGLDSLRTRFIVAPLSNGHVALLTNMAKRVGLPWDCILSAELARRYKPDREAYETAVKLLDVQPDEVMMVAAHKDDLHSAKKVGLRTAFVSRPLEWGPKTPAVVVTPEDGFDLTAQDFVDLAVQLGV